MSGQAAGVRSYKRPMQSTPTLPAEQAANEGANLSLPKTAGDTRDDRRGRSVSHAEEQTGVGR
jgi:hypothetical protein